MRVERIGNATLILGDSEKWRDNVSLVGGYLHLLQGEPEKTHLYELSVVADPPYGIPIMTEMADVKRSKAAAATGKNYGAMIGNDQPFNPMRWMIGIDQMFWGANHFAHYLPPKPGRWLNWDKRCDIIPPRCQADFELAWCSDYGAGRTFYHYWDGMVKQSEMGEQRVHPTQKPVALMRWCLQFAKGKTILDPYMGSGTTGVAAIAEGRSFIGIELSEEYFDKAVKRIRAAVDGYTPDMFAQGMTA